MNGHIRSRPEEGSGLDIILHCTEPDLQRGTELELVSFLHIFMVTRTALLKQSLIDTLLIDRTTERVLIFQVATEISTSHKCNHNFVSILFIILFELSME